MAIAPLLVKLDSSGPVFFRQERMGRGFRPFFIYKFRTMTHDSRVGGGRLTGSNDARITRPGTVSPRVKDRRASQLINVLKGDMAFVGPRPVVLEFVELFRQDYEMRIRRKSCR
jgi:lipopolysaccharide/colanic/teichoic acid biosynthesis glycosyltransferase